MTAGRFNISEKSEDVTAAGAAASATSAGAGGASGVIDTKYEFEYGFKTVGKDLGIFKTIIPHCGIAGSGKNYTQDLLIHQLMELASRFDPPSQGSITIKDTSGRVVVISDKESMLKYIQSLNPKPWQMELCGIPVSKSSPALSVKTA